MAREQAHSGHFVVESDYVHAYSLFIRPFAMAKEARNSFLYKPKQPGDPYMLQTIEGFSQPLIMDLCRERSVRIDVADLVILRWFVMMKGLDLMEKVTRDETEYVWIYFPRVIEHIPILGLDNPKSVARRFARYVKAGLLERYVRNLGRERGSKSYFAVTDVLRGLLVREKNRQDEKGPSISIDGTQKAPVHGTSKACESNKIRKEKTSPLQTWKRTLSECRTLYREKYEVGLQITRDATVKAFKAVAVPEDVLITAYSLYLRDNGTKNYLTEAKHPWQIFLSQLSTYAAKAVNGGGSETDELRRIAQKEDVGV
jgi:hypothetical protein